MQQTRAEQEAREARYWAWVRTLPPAQQEREYALERARIEAAGRVLSGLALQGSLIPRVTPRATYRQPLEPRTSCVSQMIGPGLFTECN